MVDGNYGNRHYSDVMPHIFLPLNAIRAKLRDIKLRPASSSELLLPLRFGVLAVNFELEDVIKNTLYHT